MALLGVIYQRRMGNDLDHGLSQTKENIELCNCKKKKKRKWFRLNEILIEKKALFLH